MINILPDETKEQLHYSKLNVIARRYLFVVLTIALVVGATLGASYWYADQQINELQAEIETAESEVENFAELEASVSTFNTQLAAIDELLEQRPQFALLLEDIAHVLPDGSYIGGISLSEEIDQPLELRITSPSRQQAIIVRDELLESERISSADIQNISDEGSDEGMVDVHVVIAFDPEEAL